MNRLHEWLFVYFVFFCRAIARIKARPPGFEVSSSHTSDRTPSQRLLPTQHNIHNRRTYMNSAGFEPAVPEIELAADIRLKPHGHRDAPYVYCIIGYVGKYGKPG